jgi:hypothetical protein
MTTSHKMRPKRGANWATSQLMQPIRLAIQATSQLMNPNKQISIYRRGFDHLLQFKLGLRNSFEVVGAVITPKSRLLPLIGYSLVVVGW